MRRLLVPEVVQTSNMDCGPATLKCLLEGFHLPVSYGRLREACQTGIDGTSIDTMETVANQLGLEAEQVLIPVDHLFIPEAKALPALVVVTLPNGLTHFVVVWRRHGRLLQVMDPAIGRRWVDVQQFAKEVYRHTMPAAASDWREFAASDDFQAILRARLAQLRINPVERRRLLDQALAQQGWLPLAALDAAIRLLRSLQQGGGVHGGQDCARLIDSLLSKPEIIPESYWSVRPGPQTVEGDEQILMRGAVLVRVLGRRPAVQVNDLGPELAAAISEKPARPALELLKALWLSGACAPALLLTSLLIAAGGTIAEAMLFRGLFDVTGELGLAGQRMGAMTSVLLFSLALLLLEWPAFLMGGRLGRQIENRLRVKFLEKIPKLGDRYFQSRLTSDMAERSHATKRLRHLPDQVRQLLRAVFELCCTAAAMVWLEPSSAPFALLIVAIALLPAITTQSVLAERDLRVRNHAAGLTRFYLDALLGLLAIRAHGAESSVRREHEKLLGHWAQAGLRLQSLVVGSEALQLLAMFGIVASLFLLHPLSGSAVGRVLLVVYWALNLPVLGQEIGALARQFPYYRNLTLRLLDPLGAPEEPTSPVTSDRKWPIAAPALEFRQVSVQVSGHTILEDIDVKIEAGNHVAIVGPSGAGKSSLVGLLLGWLKPSAGNILVDGELLDAEQLRLHTAWVDPAVQIWNRPLLANLSYGGSVDANGVGEAIDTALLRNVLENLADGLQTRLGEGGALVSGGEGQRVRLARALLRQDVRLVILDEPFRGLDREKRRELLARARHFWRNATLLCITHDVSETRQFDQVFVIERGRLAEAGAPSALMSDDDSRYRQLLEAEEHNHSQLWDGNLWRCVRVHSGRLVEEMPKPVSDRREAEVA